MEPSLPFLLLSDPSIAIARDAVVTSPLERGARAAQAIK
jgi:hypothetical protein